MILAVTKGSDDYQELYENREVANCELFLVDSDMGLHPAEYVDCWKRSDIKAEISFKKVSDGHSVIEIPVWFWYEDAQEKVYIVMVQEELLRWLFHGFLETGSAHDKVNHYQEDFNEWIRESFI